MRNRYGGGLKPTRKTSRASSFTSQLERTRSIPATAPVDAVDGDRAGPSCTNDEHDHPLTNAGFHQPITPAPSTHNIPWTKKIANFIRDLATPVSLSICIAIPCGIISPLKALFIPVPGWTVDRIPNAPDGNPPLAFIIDTAAFIGSISIPAALVLLGASFARLTVSQDVCFSSPQKADEGDAKKLAGSSTCCYLCEYLLRWSSITLIKLGNDGREE
jgi:hypothetical protein